MSWDIVLINSKDRFSSIEDIDESHLEPTDFSGVLESSFKHIIVDGKRRKIEGEDFSIDFFNKKETEKTKMLSINGENGLFELIELAKQVGWQIFDTGLGEMIDLENPYRNGYKNHQKYVKQIKEK
jgi:hypothetical protein